MEMEAWIKEMKWCSWVCWDGGLVRVFLNSAKRGRALIIDNQIKLLLV